MKTYLPATKRLVDEIKDFVKKNRRAPKFVYITEDFNEKLKTEDKEELASILLPFRVYECNSLTVEVGDIELKMPETTRWWDV